MTLAPVVRIGFYRHFKGGLYVVSSVEFNATLDAWCVRYHGEDGTYNRTVENFFENAQTPSGEWVPRFTKVTIAPELPALRDRKRTAE